MESSDVATLVVSVLSFAVAGGALYFTWQATRTRVVGRVNDVWAVPLDVGEERMITALLVHLTLTNARSNAVSIAGYELRIDRGRGLEELPRLRRIHDFPAFRLGSASIELPDWRTFRIDFPPRPLEHGVHIWGFVTFWSREELGPAEVERYVVTAVDSLGRRHDIEATPGAFRRDDTLELLEASGAKVVHRDQSSPSSSA